MAKQSPPYPLIFLHIPKTAGTTFNQILDRQYRKQNIHNILSDDTKKNMDDFCSKPAQYRHQVRLLRGHMSFGLHDSLAPGARYITILREPIARVISHYHYVVRTRHPLFIGKIEEQQLDLERYLQSGISGELQNGQTRWLAGVLDNRPLNQTHLDMALSNIENHFDWIGLTEKFDDSLVILARQYNWLRCYYKKQNIGNKPPERLSQSAMEKVIQLNCLDVQLYKEIQRRQDNKITSSGCTTKVLRHALNISNQTYNQLKK